MRRVEITLLLATILSLSLVGAAGASGVDCSQPPYSGIISEDLIADVFVPADTDCFIASTAVVTGDIRFADGTSTAFHVLTVEGTVDGNIVLVGSEAGGLPLFRLAGGTIYGNVRTIGIAAFDTLGVGSTVHGNVRAELWRIGFFGPSTTINGNIRCDGPGVISPECVGIFAPDVTINGNVRLNGSGDANVVGIGSSVWIDGDIRCFGAGSDSNISLSSLSGSKVGCPTQ